MDTERRADDGADAELERLLTAYGDAAVACGETDADAWRRGPEWDARIVTRRALLDYLARAYVRRDVPEADTCHCSRCGAAHRSQDAP